MIFELELTTNDLFLEIEKHNTRPVLWYGTQLLSSDIGKYHIAPIMVAYSNATQPYYTGKFHIDLEYVKMKRSDYESLNMVPGTKSKPYTFFRVENHKLERYECILRTHNRHPLVSTYYNSDIVNVSLSFETIDI